MSLFFETKQKGDKSFAADTLAVCLVRFTETWQSDCPPYATRTPIIWREQPNIAASVQNICKRCYSICNTPINLEVCFGFLNKERCRQYVWTDRHYTQHRWLIPQCLSAPTAHDDICGKVNHTSGGRKNSHWKTYHFTHPATDRAAWADPKYLCVCVWM